MPWSTGDVLVLREIWKGRVWKARPWIVVRDAADELVLDVPPAAEVRAEAQRVLAAWSLPTGWEAFRPDPTWPIPQLPEGWDVV